MKLILLLATCASLFFLRPLFAEPSNENKSQTTIVSTLTPEEEENAELAKMPTRAELRDAINNSLAASVSNDPSYLEKVHEIIERYPNTAIKDFVPSTLIIRNGDYKYLEESTEKWAALQGIPILNQYGYVSYQIHEDYLNHLGVGVGIRSDAKIPGAYHIVWGPLAGPETLYYVKFYDDRTVWDQLAEFITAYRGKDGVLDPTIWVDSSNGDYYRKTTSRAALDKDLNAFLAYWGLRLSEENDPSLGLPSRVSKHVVLVDPNSGEERQKWTLLIPLTETQEESWGPGCGTVYRASYYVIPLQKIEKKVYCNYPTDCCN